MSKRILCALWALLLILPVHAAGAPERFRLTAPLLQKLQAADAEAKRLGLDARDEDEDENEDDEDVGEDEGDDIEDVVRRIEADPAYRALLARHSLTARDVALAAQALLHAGMFLAFEKNMDGAAARRLYEGYTAEQRANIEFMRGRQ